MFLILVVFFSSCEVNKLAKTVEVKENYITDEFLVQMYDLEKIPEMEDKFSKYDLKVIDEIAPWLKMVQIKFDTEKISPEKMFAKLQLSGYVREIEFNKRVSIRNY